MDISSTVHDIAQIHSPPSIIIKMAPFSSLFDFVTHQHHHHGGVRVVVDPSSLSLDSSSSSSHSTFAVEPMKKPLSEQLVVDQRNEDDECSQRCCSKPKVSFYHSVKVQFIDGIKDYNDDEKSASWYTKIEFENMKRDRRATVRVMEDGNPNVDDGQHYFRGVENKTRRGTRRKQWNMVEATMVVLDEQQLVHRHANASQAIAEAYSAVVAHAREDAAKRGLHDQRAALEAWTTPVALSNESIGTQMPRRLSCRAA